MTPATEALVERLDPTSSLSRASLPPMILADALSQIQSDSVVAVGERRIHAENLLDMAAAALCALSSDHVSDPRQMVSPPPAGEE